MIWDCGAQYKELDPRQLRLQCRKRKLVLHSDAAVLGAVEHAQHLQLEPPERCLQLSAWLRLHGVLAPLGIPAVAAVVVVVVVFVISVMVLVVVVVVVVVVVGSGSSGTGVGGGGDDACSSGTGRGNRGSTRNCVVVVVAAADVVMVVVV